VYPLAERPCYTSLVTQRLAIYLALLVVVFSAEQARADCLLLTGEPSTSITTYTEFTRTLDAPLFDVGLSPPGGVWWIPGRSDSFIDASRNGEPVDLAVVDEGIFGFALGVPVDATPADEFTMTTQDGTTTLLRVAAEPASESTNLTLGSFVVHGGQRTLRASSSGDCCDTPPCFSVPRPESTTDDVVNYVIVRAELPPFDLTAPVPDFLVDVWFAPHTDDDAPLALGDRVIAAAHLTELITDEENLLFVEDEPGEWLLSAQLHDVRTGLRGNLVQAIVTIAEPETIERSGGCSSLSASKTRPPSTSLALLVLAAFFFSTTTRDRRRNLKHRAQHTGDPIDDEARRN
jgi:hypothetical protein